MKFIFTSEINLPIERTFELFVNKENLKEWQKEFINYELLSGTIGEVGAETKLNYKSIIIFESIYYKNAPYEIKGRYEHKSGSKTVMIHNTSYRFSQIKENTTLFELEMQDVKFVGWIPKLLSKLIGRMFEKYHQNEVDAFKIFAESNSK